MKMLTALILALVLCLALFAGCAPAANPTPAPTAAPTATPAPTAAPTDWAYIQSKGELIIGITYFEPMNYEGTDGKLTGFETEFATAVCAKLGVKAKFQVINWKTKETELAAKSIDCIWNGMTIDADRLANMDISVPYMRNKQILVVKNSNLEKFSNPTALKTAKVVAEDGSAGASVVATDALFAGCTFTPVAAQSNALLEVASGTADVGVIDYVMSIASIGEGTSYDKLSVIPNAEFGAEEYGIAFRKGSPETLAKVNAAIQALANDGTLNSIAAKYKLDELILVKPAA